MFWAVNIGNTRAVSGWMQGLKVLKRNVAETSQLWTDSGALHWAKSLQKIGKGKGFIVSSVVPPVDVKVRKAIRKVSGHAPHWLNVQKNPGIAIRYRKPSEVGTDRIANSVAAKALYGAPVIVVDYGTGTTFDIVDSKGAYRGGVILPGIGVSLKALYRYTAKLPLVSFEPVQNPIGTTTKDGIRSGLYFGTLGATREILLRVRKQLGVVAPAVATGGWCGHFRDTHIFKHIEPDLTLIGLSLLWRKSHDDSAIE
jgi:type III pantothenate kinase